MKAHAFGTVLAAAVAAAAVTASPAPAQVGAVGASSATAVVDENAHAGTPILGESGLGLARRQWSASSHAAFTSGGFGSGAQALDFTYLQVLLGAFYAPVDDLTLGIVGLPVNRVSVDVAGQSADESGFGDVLLYGKYGVHASPDGRTRVAAVGQLGLPTAKEGFGANGVWAGGGLAVSHRLEGGSLHAAGSLVLPTDGDDGDPFLDLSTAGVIAVAERVGLSLELLGSVGNESILNAGSGVRIRAGQETFIDGSLIFNLASSLEESPFDYGIVLGASFGG